VAQRTAINPGALGENGEVAVSGRLDEVLSLLALGASAHLKKPVDQGSRLPPLKKPQGGIKIVMPGIVK
jgi:hypothetical protein